MYAKVENGAVVAWPVSRLEVAKAMGNVSVGAGQFDAVAETLGFVKPTVTPAPAYNPLVERLVLTNPYVDAGGNVVRDYIKEPLQLTASEALEKLRRLIEEAGQRVVAKYPQIVREGWPEKLREARALAVDPAAQAVILAAEATVLGIAPDVLAQKVLANADAFARINGTLSGLLSKHSAAIQAAPDPTAVNAALAAANTEIANALVGAGIQP